MLISDLLKKMNILEIEETNIFKKDLEMMNEGANC
jgi:hypothetical protein